MAEQDNVNFVRQTYAAFGRGDIATVLDHLATDIVWDSRYLPELPIHGTFHGKDAVVQFFIKLGESLDVQDFAPQTFIAQDETVVVLGYEQVTVKSTGKPYKNDWVHVWTIANGKVARIQTSNNVAAAVAAFAT